MKPDDAIEEIKTLQDEMRQYKLKWREDNREKYREYKREYQRQWRKKNPKKNKENEKRTRERIKADPARMEHRRQLRRNSDLRNGGRSKTSRTPEQQREYNKRKYYRSKARKMASEKPNELRALIRPMVPGYLDPSARADVVAAVLELALQNKVRLDQLSEAVKQGVTAYNRQFDHFKNVSIDAPIAGTDGLTRADLLDSETFHF
ncbi:hypothetical protein IPU75_01000 [Ochrobactrum sp. SD129]|nr:hypothetical protein [Ochrobactrum sp. SD129]